jgi:hypothetical protein
MAADCLAKIGISSPDVLRALKQRARQAHGLAFHDTIALAVLGEVDFLLELADSTQTRDIAVRGICGLYSFWLNSCQQPRILNYRPLELLLQRPACNRRIKELYSGHCEITEASVDEALRGLESEHTVIREHAVVVLGDRRLGAEAAARILPALATRLQDRSATVRRLAILSLSRWKKAARPYAAQIRKLFKDPNINVAFTARHSQKEVS